MACNCKRNNGTKYRWTSDDKSVTIDYDTEMAAKAKVIRKGGSYTPIDAVTLAPKE